MNTKPIRLALPPYRGGAVFAENKYVNVLREKVLPVIEDTAAKELVFDNFVSLSKPKQEHFLTRLFSNGKSKAVFKDYKEENGYRLADSFYNKSKGVSRDYPKRLKRELEEKLQRELAKLR